MKSPTFLNKVAIVTGAGVGIGYEIARQLIAEGARVVVNDVDAALAEQTAQQLACHAFAGDMSDVATVRAMVQFTIEEYGQVDIAVANAGITTYGDFFNYEPDQFERVVSLNLRGSYFLAQAAARQMREQGRGGRILLMSSVTGHQAIRYLSAYGMTKAALEMLARSLVVELSPYGITINCVAPGATVTPRNLADDPHYEQVWGNVTPTRRPATVEDIANAALFLLSPAARQITGQTIVVDGGWTAISPTPALDFVEKK